MIWHYFPIGMRFPVGDFSEQTKRACWQIALSAVYAADARGTGLYEACEPFDPVSQSPVYTCIVCYVGIKQSREAGETLHDLDALLTRLCLMKPLVQANYLESYGPYPLLAQIDADGTIRPTEDGSAFIPVGSVSPMSPATGKAVLIAPDSMKGTCDAERLTRVLGTAAADRGFRVFRMPVADGGEGTVRALIAGTGGRFEIVSCDDLNGERVSMTVGVIPGPVAVIEAADAVGFARKNDSTSPIERRSCAGVGTLIRKVLDLGYRKIWIGLGGSLTADLGLGALAALGVRFTDTNGEPVLPCPETLASIAQIDRTGLDPRMADTELTLLYDVTAPLWGKDGALCTLSPQKGATAEQIDAWEREFVRIAPLLGGDPAVPGSGAAGGLGFALASIGGTLTNGADMIFERIGLPKALRNADFVITGEGSFDAQSVRFHKAPAAVLDRLAKTDCPGCLFVGKLGVDRETLLKSYPNLKGIAVCPAGDGPYEDSIHRSFEAIVLPMIDSFVNKGDL